MGEVAKFSPANAGDIMEAVIARGDLAKLNPDERAKYYVRVCESIGVNPMTRPLEYLVLNGKTVLYARKDLTDQLRTIHKVSVTDLAESEREGVFIVTAKVVNGEGRTDISKGAVTITGLKGDALANALMKAETKAKRRATLSICGLGFLDETEIETIPQAATTLPKAAAKADYAKLQAEIDAIKSAAELVEWGSLAAERIKVLPADWQDQLRLRFSANIAELRQREAENMGKVAQPAHDPDGVVWEDPADAPAAEPEPIGKELGLGAPKPAAGSAKAAMAAMDAKIDETPDAKTGIPGFLQRKQAADEHEEYLRNLEGAAGGCETADALVECGDRMPVPKGAPAAVSRRAASIMNTHFGRIEGTA